MKTQALPLNLPDFIEADVDDGDGFAHNVRYFLTLNRTAFGDWSAAYKEYESGTVLMSINHADTLEEIALRLGAKVTRYNKA